MALAQPANPTNLQSGRRNALLNALALSPRDRAALVASLSGVREGLDQVTRERRGLTAKTLVSISAQATASTLKTREETLLVDAHGRLTTGLSPDGAARLESFIQNRVKRRMVVYGDVPQ